MEGMDSQCTMREASFSHPAFPSLQSCLCAGPYGLASVLCDGCYVSVVDAWAAFGTCCCFPPANIREVMGGANNVTLHCVWRALWMFGCQIRGCLSGHLCV